MSRQTLSRLEAEALCDRVTLGIAEMRESYAMSRSLGIPWSAVVAGLASADDIEPPQPKVSHVYAMQAGHDGPIKIGRAVDPEKRRAEIQTSNAHQVTILGAVPESAHLNERTEHGRLAAKRLHGEWFDITRADLPWLEEA